VRLFWIVFAPAIAYQLLALIAVLRHAAKRRSPIKAQPPSPGISVLKPIRGLDPNTYPAFVSQAQQIYPAFELLFGVQDENDAAVPEIRRLQSSFPDVAIQLVFCTTPAANAKVGTLIDLGRRARYPIWVVNDSDIKVDENYLSQVAAPLVDPSVGLVTCPYRAYAHSVPTMWEALGIATDFMPSALVAPLLGVREFGFGSTLAFRADDLRKAGGFEAIADYLADDYQLAKRISGLGKRAILSTYTVETSLGEGTWAGVWQHQLRWAKTIRVSKGAGYAGLPITHGGVWAAIALSSGADGPALVLLVLRVAVAVANGLLVLDSGWVARRAWLAPFWDWFALAVWGCSYAGNRVRWRDRVLTLSKDGKIRQ
jgi:ceramide glucosyltransferase